MSDIQISKKFEPLFELLNDESYGDVDTVILTGGRMSSKSFNVALLCLIGVVQESWKVLFSRFTNTSIKDSIKAEVTDKISTLNFDKLVHDTQNRIEAVNNNGFISFKGIKTGSKGQTANLKSLSGFNVFVVDEAEEIPSYDTFKKVYYSIRSDDKRNLSILILNPTIKDHWIYKKFFENKVDDGYCGVNDNVMYIHSSYLDVNPDYVPDNIRRDYERLKDEYPNEYDNVVLGGWIEELEGVLFRKSELNFYDSKEVDLSNSEAKSAYIDVADTGTDYHSVPVGYLMNDKIYIEDVVFTTDDHTINLEDTANLLNQHVPEYVRVENNGVGAMYISSLEPKIKQSISLLPVRAKTKKHTRIMAQSYFIKKYFVFRSDYTHGSAYDLFMRNLTQYLKDGTSDHDDAADSLEGLAQLFKSFYEGNWDVPEF